MTFTYSIDEHIVLQDIDLPIERGGFVILTGVENPAFSLIGGIVAGLFPMQHADQVPRLEELIRMFKGDLEVTKGDLPDSTVFVGPDPEKHLLFSRVDEEVGSRPAFSQDPESVLALFHLSGDLKVRRISSLSGGEKMRLALAIAFGKRAFCTVLHGVIPWLDGDGRKCLSHEIENAKNEGRTVLLLEQEIEGLRHLADTVLFFNGKRLTTYLQDHEHRISRQNARSARSVTSRFSMNQSASYAVEFRDVDFSYDESERQGFRLDKLSFGLRCSHMYGLTGDNGTGKSTIANLILRLLHPIRGHIQIHGTMLDSMTRKDIMERVCYMSQFPEQQIMLSSVQQYRHRLQKHKKTLSLEMLERCFDKTRDYPLSMLTPLQMKLLTLATAVTEQTRILILDEPTWGIDADGLHTLLRFIDRMLEALQEPTLLVITHDHDLIRLLAASVLQLKRNGLTFAQHIGEGADFELGV